MKGDRCTLHAGAGARDAGEAVPMYGGYCTDDSLRWWAERMQECVGAGHVVSVSFNNAGAGNAARNADKLARLLSG